jgi:HK97 family phage prohead protease
MPHYATEPHRRMAFLEHVPALLARTRSGNLKLAEDSHGLQFELSIPDTRPGNDVLVLAERGDLGGMSFALIVRKNGEPEFLASRQFAVEELARLLPPAGRCAGNADTERLGPWLWRCLSAPAY